MFKTFYWRCRERMLVLDRPRIMGVINVNNDSFYSGSRHQNLEEVKRTYEKMIMEGADIIDIGAMSSRPGAALIPPQEEARALEDILVWLRANDDVILSLDTLHSSTAKMGLEIGVDVINDISGGRYDPNMMTTVGDYNAGYVMMHMRGTPKDMNQHNAYPEGVALEVLKELKVQLEIARKANLDVVIDPGFGFSKSPSQNFELLRDLSVFHALERPILVGVSRKSMIWKTLSTSPQLALNGTTAIHAWALQHHAHILRVHDVREAKEVIQLFEAMHPQKKLNES